MRKKQAAKAVEKAYQTLLDLKNSGYTIEELVDMLPALGITTEILEQIYQMKAATN